MFNSLKHLCRWCEIRLSLWALHRGSKIGLALRARNVDFVDRTYWKSPFLITIMFVVFVDHGGRISLAISRLDLEYWFTEFSR